MMRSGQLRHRLTFLTVGTPVSDGQGGETASPVTVATVWGSLEAIQGTERSLLGRLVATSTHRFRIRYSSDVAALTPRNTFTFDSRTFQITAIQNPEELGEELVGEAVEAA